MTARQAAEGALQAWPGGLQLGGGVNLDNAKQWLNAGASHVIVTSFVFREGRLEEDRLKALVSSLLLVTPCMCSQYTQSSQFCLS
jgi:phosphoribosylformimino-5-aminoimidazole carboxamide ribotide isomerase